MFWVLKAWNIKLSIRSISLNNSLDVGATFFSWAEADITRASGNMKVRLKVWSSVLVFMRADFKIGRIWRGICYAILTAL